MSQPDGHMMLTMLGHEEQILSVVFRCNTKVLGDQACCMQSTNFMTIEHHQYQSPEEAERIQFRVRI